MKIFLSHTKLDEKFCNRFDSAIARKEPLLAFRSEYETMEIPIWTSIYDAMQNSVAMFLLVGQELVKAQESICDDPELMISWKYTQNWISYEVGLAHKLGLDVWVMCDNVNINFPIPYVNNYDIGGLSSNRDITWLVNKFQGYLDGKTYSYGCKGSIIFSCPSKRCGAEFNLHTEYDDDEILICPTCLREISFKDGREIANKRALARIRKSI